MEKNIERDEDDEPIFFAFPSRHKSTQLLQDRGTNRTDDMTSEQSSELMVDDWCQTLVR